jgi:Recombinase
MGGIKKSLCIQQETAPRCYGREIEPTEADVIRRIFQLSAAGHGVKAIAKLLNAEGAPSPRAQCGRSQTWAPTSVRAVLYRPIYRGDLVWGRTAKRGTWGRKHQRGKPEADWIRQTAPTLQIVTDDEWTAAHARPIVSSLLKGRVTITPMEMACKRWTLWGERLARRTIRTSRDPGNGGWTFPLGMASPVGIAPFMRGRVERRRGVTPQRDTCRCMSSWRATRTKRPDGMR